MLRLDDKILTKFNLKNKQQIEKKLVLNLYCSPVENLIKFETKLVLRKIK